MQTADENDCDNFLRLDDCQSYKQTFATGGSAVVGRAIGRNHVEPLIENREGSTNYIEPRGATTLYTRAS